MPVFWKLKWKILVHVLFRGLFTSGEFTRFYSTPITWLFLVVAPGAWRNIWQGVRSGREVCRELDLPTGSANSAKFHFPLAPCTSSRNNPSRTASAFRKPARKDTLKRQRNAYKKPAKRTKHRRLCPWVSPGTNNTLLCQSIRGRLPSCLCSIRGLLR